MGQALFTVGFSASPLASSPPTRPKWFPWTQGHMVYAASQHKGSLLQHLWEVPNRDYSSTSHSRKLSQQNQFSSTALLDPTLWHKACTVMCVSISLPTQKKALLAFVIISTSFGPSSFNWCQCPTIIQQVLNAWGSAESKTSMSLSHLCQTIAKASLNSGRIPW